MFSSFCMRKTKAQTALLDCKPSGCFGCSPHVKTNDQIWLKISQFWLTSVADHDRFDLARTNCFTKLDSAYQWAGTYPLHFHVPTASTETTPSPVLLIYSPFLDCL